MMSGKCSRRHQNLLLGLAIVIMMTIFDATQGFGVNTRFFMKSPNKIEKDKPKLILIGGCPGTGKSTFGMAVALDQGILKCISTDTVRAVMRSFVDKRIGPALHRSSYAPAFDGDDPVRSWHETCDVLSTSVEELVDDSIARGNSLVVEGVHIVPSRELIDRWTAAGGVATGCILQIKDEEKHKAQLRRRGFITGVAEAEEKKIKSFDRIRAIQEEMMRLAKESGWLQIEQRTAPDPLELVAQELFEDDCDVTSVYQMVNDAGKTDDSDADSKEKTDSVAPIQSETQLQ